MKFETQIELRELIEQVNLLTGNKYKNWIPELLTLKGEVDIQPLQELVSSMFSAAQSYNAAIFSIYDAMLDASELKDNGDYAGLAQDYAKKALDERTELERKAIEAVKPFLNFETDTNNKYGWNKETSEKVMQGFQNHKPFGFSIFAAKTLFSLTKPIHPQVMKTDYFLQRIKDEILGLKKKYFLEFFKELGFDEAYDFVCNRMVENGKA